MRTLHRNAFVLAAFAITSTAVAQGGGFTAGDMYLYSPFLQGLQIHDGGVLKIDPLTGASSTHFLFDGSTTQHGCMAFDPYRQRLLVLGSPNGSASTTERLFFVDGSGASIEPGFPNVAWRSYAPVG